MMILKESFKDMGKFWLNENFEDTNLSNMAGFQICLNPPHFESCSFHFKHFHQAAPS